MRRCPSCGDLTTSLSCLKCMGNPQTREIDPPKCYNEHASGAVCLLPRGHAGRHLSKTMQLSWGD